MKHKQALILIFGLVKPLISRKLSMLAYPFPFIHVSFVPNQYFVDIVGSILLNAMHPIFDI